MFRALCSLSQLNFHPRTTLPTQNITAGGAPTSRSTLTHILPLVSKQFYRLTREHDLHWKNSLLRLMQNEPKIWEEGLKRVMFDTKCDELRTEMARRNRNRFSRGRRDNNDQNNQHTPQVMEDSDGCVSSNSLEQANTNNIEQQTDEEKLLQKACTVIKRHPPHQHTATSSGIYQCMYQSIVVRHLRYQAPVFIMPTDVQLGSPYGLHFFEPRYRVLMAEVMAPYPVSARRGERIMPLVPGLFPPSREQVMEDEIKSQTMDLLEENVELLKYCMPLFIHAHQMPLERDTPATIVQVLQSDIHPDGSADVMLMPLAYIYIDELWERPGTGGLLEARGIRMGKEESESYEQWCGLRRYGMGHHSTGSWLQSNLD